MADSSKQDPVLNQCPECGLSVDVTTLSPFAKIECPHCGASVRIRRHMGPYEIRGILGEGGMSQVFRAVDTHLGREVALKVLHPELSRDSALTSMFEREAKLTASILHPNVVKVYTVGQEQGYFFIAMELVRATSLEEIIASRGSLPESDVLHIAHDVTRGLAAAQEEGLIHRDIKPGNMLVTEDGTAKLVDFGLAVQQGGEDESEDLWATPFYVPPEKLEGEKDTYLGDIYSLGATFFHALAGSPPFDANTSSLEELKVIKRQELDLKSQVAGLSKATVRLVEKMMSYDEANRPQSYSEILDHIETIQKRQFGISRNSRRLRPGNRRLVLAAGVCSALLAVIVAIQVFNREDEQGGGGAIGIEPDRVISAGDNTNTEQFLRGRELLSEGNFREAEEIFDSLVTETGLSPSIRMWSQFFQGTARLFRGDEPEARQSFALIAAIEAEGESDLEDVLGLMGKSADVLSRPLPVLEASEVYSSESVETIGLLAAGLKNWQMGQFEDGLESLTLFEKSIIPEGYAWMAPLQEQVRRFRDDYARFSGLPNPSRDSQEAFDPQKETLEGALPDMKTRGAIVATIRGRINRIDRIRELEKREAEDRARRAKAKAKAESEPVPETMEEPGTDEPPTATVSLTDAEREEREEIRAVLVDLRSYEETLLFSAAVAKLKAFEAKTTAGANWQARLVDGYEAADRFLTTFAALLTENEYEGIVRRREGVPLEAKITGATPSELTLDLGFGPNPTEVGLFAPDWMVDAAGELLPPIGEGAEDSWKQVIFFALATGQWTTILPTAEALAEEDPEFAQAWADLTQLVESEE